MGLGTGSLTGWPAQRTLYWVECGGHDIVYGTRWEPECRGFLENVPLQRNAVILACERYQGAMPTGSRIALFLISYIDVLWWDNEKLRAVNKPLKAKCASQRASDSLRRALYLLKWKSKNSWAPERGYDRATELWWHWSVQTRQVSCWGQGLGWQTLAPRALRACQGGHPSLVGTIPLPAWSCYYRDLSPARRQVPPAGAAPISSPGCQSDDQGYIFMWPGGDVLGLLREGGNYTLKEF